MVIEFEYIVTSHTFVININMKIFNFISSKFNEFDVKKENKNNKSFCETLPKVGLHVMR